MRGNQTLTIERLKELAPPLEPLLVGADHLDVKSVDSANTFREFVAGIMSYAPAWVRFLFWVRIGVVRLLGISQGGVPPVLRMTPEAVPMTPGERVSFFTVQLAEEGRYWLVGGPESHLAGYLAVLVEPGVAGNRFHLVTIVHYRSWTGPVYFNLIRAFHHLAVWRMAVAGARFRPSAPR